MNKYVIKMICRIKKIIHTDDSNVTILIRLMLGVIFLSEGIQKFLFPDQLGMGRFEAIGLPWPEVLCPLVGTVEIIAGILISVGLITRIASSITLAIMYIAIATTKYQILSQSGFWVMLHGTRTDYAMIMGSIYLIINGGGRYAVDRIIYPLIKQTNDSLQ